MPPRAGGEHGEVRVAGMLQRHEPRCSRGFMRTAWSDRCLVSPENLPASGPGQRVGVARGAGTSSSDFTSPTGPGLRNSAKEFCLVKAKTEFERAKEDLEHSQRFPCGVSGIRQAALFLLWGFQLALSFLIHREAPRQPTGNSGGGQL